MSTYDIRSQLRECEKTGDDNDITVSEALSSAIEDMTYKLDRANATIASFRDVLRAILN